MTSTMDDQIDGIQMAPQRVTSGLFVRVRIQQHLLLLLLGCPVLHVALLEALALLMRGVGRWSSRNSM